MTTDLTDDLDTPTARLWEAVDSAVAPATMLSALCGIPHDQVEDVVELFACQSDEAAVFIEALPHLMRHLVRSSVVRSERCVGHVRGAIQWSETITAWSSGLGVDDVFVCSSMERSYDVAENRLLVWMLRRLARAGSRLDSPASTWFNDVALAQIADVSSQARAALRHRYLSDVNGTRLNRRDLLKVATGRHVAHYSTALDLHARYAQPFDADEVADACDDVTLEDHRVIELLLNELRNRGRAVPLLAVRHGIVESGPLRYHSSSDESWSGPSGITFGGIRVHTSAQEQANDDAGTSAHDFVVTTASEAADVVNRILERDAIVRPPRVETKSTESASTLSRPLG